MFVDKPWVCVAENVKRDLLSSFRRVKSEMVENVREEVKPSLVARVGRILFHGLVLWSFDFKDLSAVCV